MFDQENQRIGTAYGVCEEELMVTTKRNKKGRPEKWEIAIIKAIIEKYPKTEMSNQDILAYFSRPTRSLNSRVISEIRNDADYSRDISKANSKQLSDFLKNWPHTDFSTGLNLIEDELIIKSRESMLLAVQTFNNPKSYFRSEIFIVLSIISWTYLLHAFLKSKKVDYRQKGTKDGKIYIKKTKYGAERYWELLECIKHQKCDLSENIKDNLKFLSTIRDEVEHRMTRRIDSEFAFKFQLACIQYNNTIKNWFGNHLGLDKELSIALQFSTFNTKQTTLLLKEKGLPKNIEAAWQDLYGEETGIEKDNALEVGFFFKKKIVNHEGQAEEVVEFINDKTSHDTNNIYIKYHEPTRYLRKDILRIVHEEGYTQFGPHQHTILWKTLDAQNPAKGFGKTIIGMWTWNDKWLQAVRQHCRTTYT